MRLLIAFKPATGGDGYRLPGKNGQVIVPTNATFEDPIVQMAVIEVLAAFEIEEKK